MCISSLTHILITYLPVISTLMLYTARSNIYLAAALLVITIWSVKARLTNKRLNDYLNNAMIASNSSTLNPYRVISPPTGLDLDQYKKCIIMLAPHGPTILPVSYIMSLLKQHYGVPNQVWVAPMLLKVPYVSMVLSAFGSCVLNSVHPKSFIPFIEGDNGPYSIYHGGFDDIFDNCEDNSTITININPISLLFKLAAKNKKALVPVLIVNETEIFTHNKYVVKVFKYVHKNFIRVGLPLPPLSSLGLPFYCSGKQMVILCGEPIWESDADTLVTRYVASMRELHSRAVGSGYTKKTLNIKMRGTVTQ